VPVRWGIVRQERPGCEGTSGPDVAGRIETIRKMLEAKPDDVFLRYSLGMELASAGLFDQAAAEFSRCIELDGEYLPAYVEAGKALRAGGRLDEARGAFAAGEKLAAARGETHTRDHIRQQIESLPSR